MEQHRQPPPGDGLIGVDGALVVDGELLEIRVDLDAAQAELQHPVKLLLIAVHARVDRAEGKIAFVAADGLGQEGVGVEDLLRARRGVGDDAAGNACQPVLGRQAVHVGLALNADAVEIADGVRRLLGQLVRENVCVDICDLHGMTSVYIAYAEIQTK